MPRTDPRIPPVSHVRETPHLDGDRGLRQPGADGRRDPRGPSCSSPMTETAVGAMLRTSPSRSRTSPTVSVSP